MYLGVGLMKKVVKNNEHRVVFCLVGVLPTSNTLCFCCFLLLFLFFCPKRAAQKGMLFTVQRHRDKVVLH